MEDTAELRLPGDHVVRLRVLLAPPGADELPLPTWNENEFLLAYGRRPTIRTFTPRRTDPHAGELDVEIVVHDGGAASDWAEAAAPAARRPSRA